MAAWKVQNQSKVAGCELKDAKPLIQSLEKARFLVQNPRLKKKKCGWR